MPSQAKTEFKNSAIKLYLKIESIRNVCNLLDIKKSTLHRWLIRYFETGNVARKEYDKRKSIVNDTILKYITESIKTNPTITLAKLKKRIFKNYEKDVSISYLYYIIKYKLNLTHKQLKHKYYPEKKLSTLKKDKLDYFNNIIKIGKRNIISIDETGFYLNMAKNNGRCIKGKRCYRTVHKYPFVKFNFICAIKYGKIIGYKLYEKDKGGIDVKKFNEFYNEYIKGKYQNNLIVMDNAKFHKSKETVENIMSSKNKILNILCFKVFPIIIFPNCNQIITYFCNIFFPIHSFKI